MIMYLDLIEIYMILLGVVFFILNQKTCCSDSIENNKKGGL